MDKDLEVILDGIMEAGLGDVLAGVDKIMEAFDEATKDYPDSDRDQLMKGIEVDLQVFIADALDKTRYPFG